MFILKHQDGDIQYKFEKGGFAIIDSKLYLSIETKAILEEAFPDRYLFAIAGYPIEKNINNIAFIISIHPNNELPNVYVYTTFHACEVKVEIYLKILSSKNLNNMWIPA